MCLAILYLSVEYVDLSSFIWWDFFCSQRMWFLGALCLLCATIGADVVREMKRELTTINEFINEVLCN